MVVFCLLVMVGGMVMVLCFSCSFFLYCLLVLCYAFRVVFLVFSCGVFRLIFNAVYGLGEGYGVLECSL